MCTIYTFIQSFLSCFLLVPHIPGLVMYLCNGELDLAKALVATCMIGAPTRGQSFFGAAEVSARYFLHRLHGQEALDATTFPISTQSGARLKHHGLCFVKVETMPTQRGSNTSSGQKVAQVETTNENSQTLSNKHLQQGAIN